MGGLFLWPRDFTTANYRVIFTMGGVSQALFISIMRVIAAVPLHLLVTSMCAYALSRKEMSYKNFFITVFFITIIFSGGLIPYYLLLSSLGLLNNFAVYIIPGLFSVWDFIVFKTMFKTTVSESMIEASLMDGAGHFRIFMNIVIPLSLPVYAALALFNTVSQWNDWFVGLYFISDAKLVPLQSFLRSLINKQGDGGFSNFVLRLGQEIETRKVNSFSVTMAAVIVVVAPILLVYPFLQKYFVSGVMIGAVKE
jgi:ABC-type sugar transport system, permease component